MHLQPRLRDRLYFDTSGLTSGRAWTETIIHAFKGFLGADGENPQGVVLVRGSGVYGDTPLGGISDNFGTVFRLQRPAVSGDAWNERILSSLGQFGGGNLPHGGPLAGQDGALYLAGAGGAALLGAVFELTPPVGGVGRWPKTLLYSFIGGTTDGAFPTGPPVADANGVLYGGATNGVNGVGCGVVYSVTPPLVTGGTWTESIVYSFLGGDDGCNPIDKLTVAPDGTLYGVTAKGGASNLGTVYQLTPPAVAGGAWAESVIHTFTGNPDGSSPNGGVVINMAQHTLDGTAAGGGTAACDCGVVYALVQPAIASGVWTEAILHSFSDGPSDGNSPAGPLLVGKNGTLYGVTASGGASITHGTVFSITP